MAKEREVERRKQIDRVQAERDQVEERQRQITAVKDEFFALFGESDRHKRGKALEGVLNRLFATYGVLVRESLTLVGTEGEGIVEQVDGVVELNGHLYFVEMKWWDEPLGVAEISQHMMRVMFRAESRAIIVSASEFTAPAITTCKEALQQKVVVLCTLEEIVMLLKRKKDLSEFFRRKVHAAQIDKNPFLEIRS